MKSIVDLTSKLVRIPSRAGLDPVDKILDFLSHWLAQRHLPVHRLRSPTGADVGLYLRLRSDEPGPALCLNACLDTAPFGDAEAWHYPPASGVIEDGRLHGRGAADSKIAVAIFSHLAAAFQHTQRLPRGELYIVFDADEHTGDFQGIKSFLKVTPRRPAAVLIGYPGNDKLVAGSRGFLRAEITVYGLGAHSGSSHNPGFNAILKMAHLIQSLHSRPLPQEEDPAFKMGPKVTVTEVQGGEGFSLIPDRCDCKVDFRLTPHVDKKIAAQWIESVVHQTDAEHPGTKPTHIDCKESWPAYRVPAAHPLVQQFLEAAQEVFGRDIPPVVSGPSNIGNYLASKNIPALSGFGVSYANIHAPDESVEIETIAPVYEVYRRAIEKILRSELPAPQ
ncbi:MAG: M20 family metallopeptidase [Armatimonadota bacterium]|nr:M20 family metallopeptidase [Armatimonadota bacterium]